MATNSGTATVEAKAQSGDAPGQILGEEETMRRALLVSGTPETEVGAELAKYGY